MENSKGLARHQYKILILPQAFSTREKIVSNETLQVGFFFARTEHWYLPKTVPSANAVCRPVSSSQPLRVLIIKPEAFISIQKWSTVIKKDHACTLPISWEKFINAFTPLFLPRERKKGEGRRLEQNTAYIAIISSQQVSHREEEDQKWSPNWLQGFRETNQN